MTTNDNGYLRDLLDQPRALRDTIAALNVKPALAARRFARIVLTGMGSSLHALHPMNQRLAAGGFCPVMAETSELLHGLRGLLTGETLLVAVSQSGRSAETVRLLEQAGPRPHTIGVTNTPDSPLALVPDAAIVTRAGAENSVACKTYLSILAALDWLGSVLCGDDLEAALAELAQAPWLAENYLTRWQNHVEQLCSELAGIEHVFLAGRGRSLATVGNGGLILKESAHVHAEGMSAPAFRHGPIEMLRDDVFVLVFAGEPATAPLNVRLFDDIRNAGGRTALISESAAGAFRLPAGPARLCPILEMLPVQMMSLALAQLKDHEPGVFRHTSKVTTVE